MWLAVPAAVSASQRLSSLDALRGFTMFWIIGGSEVIVVVRSVAVILSFQAARGSTAWPVDPEG